MRTYFRACLLVAGFTLLGFAVPTVFGQPPKADTKAVGKPPAKAQLTLKVFKLERADPEAVTSAMTSLLEESDMEIPPPPGTPVPILPAGGGMLGFGGMGGMGGTVVTVWRATVEERTKSVIVRGSARHIQVATDLVALLDRAPNAPLPQLQVLKAFSLKNLDATDLTAVIEALSFDDLRMSSPEEKLLVVLGPDEATKAIAELVKELDVPVKPSDETKPKKAPNPKPKM